MSLTVLIVLVTIALLIQAFLSGSQIALISADRLTLRKLANRGDRGAVTALSLLSHPEKILATTLIGENLSICFQATISTLYVYHNLGAEYDLYAGLILGPIALTFGEILPKTIFQKYSIELSRRVAPVISIISRLLTPVIWLLSRYTNRVSKILEPAEELITGKLSITHREELSYLLTYGKRQTTLKTSERRMIRKIFDFSRSDAKKALRPLVKLDMIEDVCTQSEALDAFLNYGHSRLPVYHDRVDNIVGVLNVYDVFSEKDPDKPVSKLMQPSFFAPVTQQLDDLLFTMRKRGNQMAIVVDEYGGAVGSLTLEDILEEIVGDIKDEFDEETSDYREIGEGSYIIQARMEIRSINEKLDLDLPKGAYETLAGFLLQQFNRIPDNGDELFFKGLKFVIRKANPKSIELVQVSRID